MLKVHEAKAKFQEGRESPSSEGSSGGVVSAEPQWYDALLSFAAWGCTPDPLKACACSSTTGAAAWDVPEEQGSIFFTSAADDPFCQEYEARRRVCTSRHESVKEQQPRTVPDLQDDVDDRCQDLHISARTRQPLSNILNCGTPELFQVCQLHR